MKLKPLQDKVVLEPIDETQKTVGGIILPKVASEKPSLGKVISVGNGTKDCEMIVKENDTVLFSKYAGSEFKFGTKTYILISQEDILAIVEEQ